MVFNAYINGFGKFLPGEAIANEEMEAYLGKVNGKASKLKQKILNSNGIQQRYYAIDKQQQTTWSNSQMAANAVRDVLVNASVHPQEIDLLACGTTLPDLLIPGFASMVHGELPELSPLEIVSTQGVCCAGVSALNYAASQIQLGRRQGAIAVAAEFASRLFKHTHFETENSIKAGGNLDFETEFLRWMLSDGAGACLIQNYPNYRGISLKIEWIELISHANAYPLCMYAGTKDQTSWLDYPSYVAAAEAGVMNLRQNIRLLDNVIKLGVEGWLRLIELGKVQPENIDWLLCHYSSHFFRGKIVELLSKADCLIPESKWFTNLYSLGNTGCASIYLMLEELFNSGKLEPNQQIFCFIPESGRFTTAYMLLKVVEASPKTLNIPEIKAEKPLKTELVPDKPIQAQLLRQLTQVWLEFERKLRSVPIILRLNCGEFSLEDYKALLRNLRPQVVEGARWIARAASNMTDFQLRSTLIGHAQAEHRDFQMLERNYTSVGGKLEDIVNAEKNIGGEALSAYIFHQASQPNPVQLLGSIFIIEGLGHQLAGKWASQIQSILKLEDEQVSFLAYHGANDESHLAKIEALLQADWLTSDLASSIVKTAQVTARLYLLQLEEIN